VLTPYLPTFLSLGIRHLQILLPVFREYYVLSGGGSPPPVSTADDPDQEVSVLQFASLIFDLLSQAVRGGRTKSWFVESNNTHIASIIELIPGWIQMTDEDVSGMFQYAMRHQLIS
jgi:hypothetical protein